MSAHYSRIFDFWKELKRRKILRVVTASAALPWQAAWNKSMDQKVHQTKGSSCNPDTNTKV
jgi:hypothetical protein